MNGKPQIQTVDREYPRFHFRGLMSKGTCFVRARVRPDGLVILCAQLYGYNETSVTQAIEEVREAVIEKLHEDAGLEHLMPARKWWQCKGDLGDVLASAADRATMIEHWPKGRGLAPAGSFAIVEFDDAGQPEWDYLHKSVVAHRCSVDDSFLTVDPEGLHFR